MPGVVTVAGTGRGGSFWTGSVHGPRVSIAAPAKDIVSSAAPAQSSTGYASGVGTSASAAIVSGVVALIRARYPKLNAANVINRLVKTSDDKGPKGRDGKYGFGVVDPVAALTAAVPFTSVNPLGDPNELSRRSTPKKAATGLGKDSFDILRTLTLSALALMLIAVTLFTLRRLASRR
ncbi:MAG: S8 family serine peptidase [Actinocatenispora sp.]